VRHRQRASATRGPVFPCIFLKITGEKPAAGHNPAPAFARSRDRDVLLSGYARLQRAMPGDDECRAPHRTAPTAYTFELRFSL
jgi:hypothetical protein